MIEKNKTLRAFNLASSTYDKNNDIQEDIFQVLVSTLPQTMLWGYFRSWLCIRSINEKNGRSISFSKNFRNRSI